jgi:DNA-binding NarL/FixJ family response regulator
MNRPRLLIADDHTIVLEGLRKLLEADFEVVGMVEDGRAMVNGAQQLAPDVVLLDISMPLLNGIEAAKQIRKLLPKVKVVFLTMHSDAEYVREAFRAGASAYLLKRSAATELVSGINEVLRGRTYISSAIAQELGDSLPGMAMRAKASSGVLTDRQREVLQLLAEGSSTKEIAAMLNITVKTVEFHKATIRAKLHLHGTAELTRYAIANRIVGT